MDIVKAIIFFTIIAFDVFMPASSISRTSFDYASKPQVLGENTKVATRTSEIKRAIISKPLELRPTPATGSSEIANIYRNLEMNIKAIQNSSDSAKEEKKQTVLTISSKIASINKNVTEKMSSALDKLDTVIKNLINQTATLKSDNKDTLSIE